MYQTSAIPAHNYQRPTWGKPNTGYEGRGRMAEDRAGYTTDNPADAADAEQAEPTEQQDRASCWFAKVPATVIRDRRLTAGARDVLIDLLLYANAQGRCYPKQNTIACDLGVKRQMVNRHLRTLRLLGYLVIESGKERGAQCVYHINLAPPIQEAQGGETLSDTPTGETPSDDGRVSSEVTGGETLSDTPVKLKVTGVSRQVSPLTEPYNRPSDQTQSTDPQQTANAGETAEPLTTSRASPSPARKSASAEKRPRKLNDEQLIAHRAEAVYLNSVLAAYRAELRIAKLPSEGQQRSGARWFYTAGADSQPIPADDLMEWYRLTKHLPFWRGRFLSLASLQKPFAEHGGDLTAYRATIAQEATEGDHHATTYRASAANAYAGRGAARSATQQPDPHKDGVYAAFVD